MAVAASLTRALDALQGNKVLIVGDIMLDHYLVGRVDRISPEAPVPVVQVREERHLLGGAGNVARNIKSLGGTPLMVSVRGADADGDTLERLLNEEGVDCRLIVDPARPTTKKTRIMAHNQQVVRVDTEMPDDVLGQILDEVFQAIALMATQAPVIVVSDYGKGMVSREFMTRLLALSQQLDPRPLIYVDPKVRNFPLYGGVDLLTPNTKEAAEGTGIPVENHMDVVRAGLGIFKALRNRHLLITLGPDGMALFEGPGQVWHIPTAARKVLRRHGRGRHGHRHGGPGRRRRVGPAHRLQAGQLRRGHGRGRGGGGRRRAGQAGRLAARLHGRGHHLMACHGLTRPQPCHTIV